MINEFTKTMIKCFEMTYFDLIEVSQQDDGIFLSQKMYVIDVLKKKNSRWKI